MSGGNIAKFYEDREIFITGGTGFMGKVLIEKLARSCPKVKAIYVLIRAKKDKTAADRISEITDTPLFDKLRECFPENLKKIIAIGGDVLFDGLGISEADLKRMSNVSIIFHSAASVRFDDPLREAIRMNTKGCYQMLELASKLKNIAAYIQVSTAYCNPDKLVIEEKVYPPYADWKSAISVTECFDNDVLEPLNCKYRCMLPNTYTFTKNLAESIVNEYKDNVPCAIFRPTIVMNTLNDPMPGWTENFNGPTLNMIVGGHGIMTTTYSDPNVINDYVPVDLCIKGMIVAAYRRGTESTSNNLEVYNYSLRKYQRVTFGGFVEEGKKLVHENPFEKFVLVPHGSITACVWWHRIRFFLFQFLMAIILDTGLKYYAKKKPFFMKTQRKIVLHFAALKYFVSVNWDFKNENLFKLEEYIEKDELADFSFLSDKDFDFVDFFRNSFKGIRKYLLKEPAECSEATWRRHKRLKLLNNVVFYICLLCVAKFILIPCYYYITSRYF